MAPPPTGTSEMPLLCADICTTQQTVSCVILLSTDRNDRSDLFLHAESSNSCFKNWSWVLDVLITDDYVRPCFAYWQGQFPCPLHSLGEATPQYWFEILDVLEERSHSSNVHPATTPSLLITLEDIMYLTGMFSFLHLVTNIVL